MAIASYIIKVLLLDNPWLEGEDISSWYARFLPEPFIPRQVVLKSPDHRVCLVVGPRQAGKSSLIWKTLSEKKGAALYLNCEEPAIREFLLSPAAFLADIKELVPPGIPFFFDEIQYLPEAGLFLKGLVDRRTGHPLYATGSSAFDLEAKTRESLAGRALRHVLLPFSLAEAGISLSVPPALLPRKKHDLLQRFLLYGGYPLVHTGKNPEEELISLVEAFVIRDASDRIKIKFPAAFRKIMELVASQIGNLCNYSEWAAIAGISVDTVIEYLGIMDNTHIVKLVRPYVGGKRAELTKTPKAYFVDNGIRNQVFGGFTPLDQRQDRGSLLENFVFSELYKAINPVVDSLKYWRSKSGAEVDFVLEQQGRITGFEVKAGPARGKVTRSAQSFIRAYQPDHFFVINEQAYSDLCIQSTRVHFLTADYVHRLRPQITQITSTDYVHRLRRLRPQISQMRKRDYTD